MAINFGFTLDPVDPPATTAAPTSSPTSAPTTSSTPSNTPSNTAAVTPSPSCLPQVIVPGSGTLFLEEGGLGWYGSGSTLRAGMTLSEGDTCVSEPHLSLGMEGGEEVQIYDDRVSSNAYHIRVNHGASLPDCVPARYGTVIADTRPGAVSGSLVMCVDGTGWERVVKGSEMDAVLARLDALEAR